MTPSILITQCLQNDFVKIIGQHDPLPNKLHIGYDEVIRIFGELPEKGMLLNLMQWAYQQNSEELKIINIRDWHDPNNVDQKKHLEQFGLHCIQDTKGAEFVFENYRRTEKEHIVNASGLNDFVDTNLEEFLNQYKGLNIKIGIIGVWTEAKVSYLCYDLASRFPEFELAVCSSLTASSSTHMHYVSLDQLKKVLNVNVFSSVTEFAQFLSTPDISLPLGIKPLPKEHSNFLFDDDHTLSEDDIDLLSYLYRNSKQVSFKVLDGGFSGNVVMKATAVDIHGHEELPTVIKIGERNSIAYEKDSFEKVEDVLGNNAPSIVGYLENENRAAIKYRYASMFDESVITFQKFYEESHDEEQIKNFIEIVFKKQLGRFYKAATIENIDLLSYYDFSSKYADSVCSKVEKLVDQLDIDSNTLCIEGKEVYNLVKFYKNDLDEIDYQSAQSHYLSYVHGDLNGANIIIDARDNVWLIDFFHTHRGHILKDLIKLENDVVYIFMKINSKGEFEEACTLIDTLIGVEDLWAPIKECSFNSAEIQKAYNTIKLFRSYYPDLIQLDRSPFQLLVGLMRYSVHTISFEECNIWQKKLALYSSCRLAAIINNYILESKKLRFDLLNLDKGEIGMTILPGRTDRKRDLNSDLNVIQENKFDSVLSLITRKELEDYGVPNLIDRYNELNLSALQISVPDQGIPSKEEMTTICKWINNNISNGKKILIHCVGGLGRTGTVAACYLKEYKGLNSEDAIKTVRESRSPRAIETKIQEKFIAEY